MAAPPRWGAGIETASEGNLLWFPDAPARATPTCVTGAERQVTARPGLTSGLRPLDFPFVNEEEPSHFTASYMHRKNRSTQPGVLMRMNTDEAVEPDELTHTAIQLTDLGVIFDGVERGAPSADRLLESVPRLP